MDSHIVWCERSYRIRFYVYVHVYVLDLDLRYLHVVRVWAQRTPDDTIYVAIVVASVVR